MQNDFLYSLLTQGEGFHYPFVASFAGSVKFSGCNPSTHSVGMSLAWPFKAGDYEMDGDSRRPTRPPIVHFSLLRLHRFHLADETPDAFAARDR